jgi:hypothetical protein
VIKRNPTGCDTLIGDLQIEFPGDYQGIITQILDKLRQINDPARLAAAVEQIQTLINSEEMSADLLARIQGVVDQALEQDRPRIITYGELMGNLANGRRRAEIAALSDSALLGEVLELGNGNLELQVELGELESRLENLTQWLPGRQLLFCCPPNSVIEATRTRAESNLFKLRHCRNIAGLEMQVEPYAMPSITGSPLPPLPYRYSVLIQRAQQLVQFAQQMENSMLNALVTLGQRQYEHVKARQDLALAQASVRLKELQRIEAADGVALAQLQRGRAQLQARHYSQLLFEGLSTGELAALGAMAVATTAEFAGIYSAETVVKWAGAAAAAFGRAAELASTAANYERREQEWRFQRDIAAQDIISAQEQIRLAYDRVLITTEDREAARMGVQFAETILDFMETKRFDNAALYEWMSSVLEQVYRFFLQQATSIARLAEAQLAFERQEIPPAFIQTDYWEPPAKSKPPTANGQTANVHGLTGSARLLRDITELDQYAFRTDQRKLQLAETFSLMQLDPIAFQHFRETGKLPFDTPMRLFESKFPGHYLRLIRRVKLSVIALIPPTQGIRATLSTVGTSRVVIRDNIYQTVNIQRGPETIALTSPINATGLFDLDPQPEMLVPFEGIGVDTSWVFHLPKAANQFDYNTIADVLFTLEYTALNDFDYAQRVIKRLDSQFSADRPFSFRRDFADAWWDLHNPEQTPKPFVVSFQTGESDFPANVEDLRIGQVVLYFAFRQGKPTPVDALNLQYSYLDPSNNNQPVNVGPLSAVPIKGIISTRANAWIQLRGSHRVEGTWTLDFNPPAGDPQRVQKLERLRALFDGDHLDDLLLVITCSGRTPVW